MFNDCLIEIKKNILLVTINRPDMMNAVRPSSNRELAQIFNDFESNDNLRAAIITGAGEQAFCAGNDLKFTQQATKAELEPPAEGFGGLTSNFKRKKPVIAAVNGIAMGGGFEIALAADIIVAADNAKFGLPEVKVGLCAFAGGLHRLIRQIPYKKAVEIILTGNMISAEEGLNLGFVNHVVSSDGLLDKALSIASEIADNAPLSVATSLDILSNSQNHDSLEQAMLMDAPHIDKILASKDFVEGVAAFTEKRKPRWEGR